MRQATLINRFSSIVPSRDLRTIAILPSWEKSFRSGWARILDHASASRPAIPHCFLGVIPIVLTALANLTTFLLQMDCGVGSIGSFTRRGGGRARSVSLLEILNPFAVGAPPEPPAAEAPPNVWVLVQDHLKVDVVDGVGVHKGHRGGLVHRVLEMNISRQSQCSVPESGRP